jgi:hypothetical protein
MESVHEIAKPIHFAHNLDLSEARAIERRLAELVPYEEEAKALRRRLVNVNRRLGVETQAKMVERRVVQCLIDNEGRMPRSLIVRDLELDEVLVKSALERLRRKGKVENPQRGFWVLTGT